MPYKDRDVPCDVFECPYWSEYVLYPRRKVEVLAIHLCYDHHLVAVTNKHAKQDLYTAASQTVRKSLGGK